MTAPEPEVGNLPAIQEGETRPVAWDPFQLMDRLDEDALRKELEGIASTDLVYVVREGSQEIVGLSKTGVDECCMALVAQGQVIREEDAEYQIVGEGQDREALFKVYASRFAISPTGLEVRLDKVIGVKRQSLYFEAQTLDLDAKVPSKKYKGATYRELLEREDGRDYLAWMAENFKDESIRDFVRKILDGEVVSATGTRQLNPHWYEAGMMKAARNARFRLIPAQVRARMIALARASGQTHVVDRPATTTTAPRTTTTTARTPEQPPPQEKKTGPAERQGAFAPSEKQVAFFTRLADSPVFTDEERRKAMEWLSTKATRQTIKDQIDWLKRTIDSRKAQSGKAEAAPAQVSQLPRDCGERAASDKQIALIRRLMQSHHLTDLYRDELGAWIQENPTVSSAAKMIDWLTKYIADGEMKEREAKAAAPDSVESEVARLLDDPEISHHTRNFYANFLDAIPEKLRTTQDYERVRERLLADKATTTTMAKKLEEIQ